MSSGVSALAVAPHLRDDRAEKRSLKGIDMQRRVFFSGMIVALLCATASLASDYQSSVEAQLRAQGFSDIRVETTWLGRLKITAQRRGTGREIVLNPRNGEILRDIISTQNGAVMPRISDDRDDHAERERETKSSRSSASSSSDASGSSRDSSSGSANSSSSARGSEKDQDDHGDDTRSEGDDHDGERHD